MEHWFGRKVPGGSAACAWGARAIYAYDTKWGWGIDLLHDRQQAIGSEEHRALLGVFLDTYAMPRLRAEFPTCEQLVFSFEHGGWFVEASENDSHGYLYIGVWPAGAGNVPTEAVASYVPKPPAPKPVRQPPRRNARM